MLESEVKDYGLHVEHKEEELDMWQTLFLMKSDDFISYTFISWLYNSVK